MSTLQCYCSSGLINGVVLSHPSPEYKCSDKTLISDQLNFFSSHSQALVSPACSFWKCHATLALLWFNYYYYYYYILYTWPHVHISDRVTWTEHSHSSSVPSGSSMSVQSISETTPFCKYNSVYVCALRWASRWGLARRLDVQINGVLTHLHSSGVSFFFCSILLLTIT